MINGMDFLIVFTFLGIIGVGFFSGVTRVTAAIFSLYFGAIFSAAFYRPLTDLARKYLVTLAIPTGQLFSFLILLAAFTVVFTFILSRILSESKLPRRLQIFDNIGGAVLGMVVSGLAMTLAAMLLAIMLQALNQTVATSGRVAMFGAFRSQIDSSTLVPIFLKMAPFFAQIISPWFPGGLPPILSAGVS